MKFLACLILLATLAGCYQASSEDEPLRTIPVTNNHNLIPDMGKKGLMPGTMY